MGEPRNRSRGGGGGGWGFPDMKDSLLVNCCKVYIQQDVRNGLNHLNNFRRVGVCLIESGLAAQGYKLSSFLVLATGNHFQITSYYHLLGSLLPYWLK